MIKELKLIPQSQPDIAVLIKAYDVSDNNKSNLMYRYVQKLAGFGVDKPGFRFTFLGLEQNPDPKKKIRKPEALACVTEILEYCDTIGIHTLVCTDSLYFQILTGRPKLEESIDGVYNCCISTYEHIKVLPSIHYNSIIMAPQKEALLEKSLKILAMHLTGNFVKPGSDVLKNYTVCKTPLQLRQYLESIMYRPEITCDIEATSLKFYKSELLTIAFGLDKHTAMACPIHKIYHNENTEKEFKEILKWFFKTYNGKLWFHNALFDVKQLTYRLFMTSLDDFNGMQEGLNAFENVHDTFMVAYLAKNSTYRQPLGLKELSKEFMGEYAEDVKEAIKVAKDDLLLYNAKDCCATWYVLDTYRPIMIQDDQQYTYDVIMQPSMKPLLKMMLTGLPLDLDRTYEAKIQLQAKLDEAVKSLHNSHYVKRAVSVLKYQASVKYNETHKTKQKTPDEIELEFNPNSSDQLRLLLFEILGFEEIEKTKAGKSSTKRGFIEEYLLEAKADGDTEVITCLESLVAVSQISIILNTFINAFEELSIKHPSGYSFLKGNLKLGGTQSGRLSSSEPNLQNLPSGSKYGKIIKNCFVAPDGWLFAGADFSALEDRIGAILSKDKNKTLEFQDGFDGHSLRALAFFPEELPEGLSIDSLADNKLIKKEYGDIRGKSKGPSFAMQYGCGPGKIQQLLKCPKSKAEQVYSAYHNLYSGLAQFAQQNKIQGMTNGYVTGAFGLRLRTPKLKAHKSGTKESTEVGSEARSASNMVTQSWGMLMNRAFIEFNTRLEKSPYNSKVRLINTIHDAVYCLVKAEPEVVNWVNINLVECMQWQEGLIAHNGVKMEAEIDFGLDWAHQETLHNNASIDEINDFLEAIKLQNELTMDKLTHKSIGFKQILEFIKAKKPKEEITDIITELINND